MAFTEHQKKLIEAHREHATDYHWWNETYDDFIAVARAFGIRTERDMISFSGFWSQGDGASFETANFTLDEILSEGIKTLETGEFGGDPDKWEGYTKEFYLLYKLVFDKIGHHCLLHPEGRQVAESYGRRIYRNGPYSHEHTMRIDDSTFSAWTAEDDLALAMCVGLDLDGFDDELLRYLRDCAKELYRALEDQYDSMTDDESVWEMIVSNGWDTAEEEEDGQA